MITVEIEKTKTTSENIFSDFFDKTLDDILKLAKEHLENQFKDYSCEIHNKNSKGRIIIKKNADKREYELVDFCCDDFKEKIRSASFDSD